MAGRLFSRRDLLTAGAAGVAGVGVAAVSPRGRASAAEGAPKPFRYCLNTGTIRGHKLGLVEEIEVTARAGYDAIEPWVGSIGSYAKGGGSLKDLRKRIEDRGLTVESGIAFSSWIADDDARRAKGLEQAKREMDLLAQIGGKRIAAPPAGATGTPGLDLLKAAERYRALLEAGDQIGVVPQIEIWGFSKNLHRIGQSLFVAVESGHPKACLLPDIFHIYKGGSDFNGLKLVSARAMPVFHVNDYPADPPRTTIRDSHRVFTGDGVAPVTKILRDLAAGGGGNVLSLELFNPTYWKREALAVAREGLAKMKASVAKALPG